MNRLEPWRGRLALIVLVLTVACEGSAPTIPTPPPEQPPELPTTPVATTVTIAPDSAELSSLGDTVHLTATVLDQNGQVIADASVSWASSDDSVATVTAVGVVTAIRNGSVAVTATSGSASASTSVKVAQQPVEMDVLPAAATLFSLGDTLRLVADALDANGNAVADFGFSWTSQNDAIATVDTAGLVTAVRTGSANIFAEAGEFRDSAGVTVAQLAVEVQVTPQVDTLDAVGDTVRLTAVAVDRKGNVVEDTDYAWSARHPSVVTVDDAGLVTATGPGTGEIWVKASRAGGNNIGRAMFTVRQTGGGSAGSRDGDGTGLAPGPAPPWLPATHTSCGTGPCLIFASSPASPRWPPPLP